MKQVLELFHDQGSTVVQCLPRQLVAGFILRPAWGLAAWGLDVLPVHTYGLFRLSDFPPAILQQC